MPRAIRRRAYDADPSEQPSFIRDFRLGVLPQARIAEGPPVDVCTTSGAAKMLGSTVGDTTLEMKRSGQVAIEFPELGARAVSSYTMTLDCKIALPEFGESVNGVFMPLVSGMISVGSGGEFEPAAPVAAEPDRPPSKKAEAPKPLARLRSQRWHRVVLSVAAERAPGRVSVYVDGQLAGDWRLTSELLRQWRYDPTGPVVILSGRSSHPLQLRLFDVLPHALDAEAVLKREAFRRTFVTGRDDQALD